MAVHPALGSVPQASLLSESSRWSGNLSDGTWREAAARIKIVDPRRGTCSDTAAKPHRRTSPLSFELQPPRSSPIGARGMPVTERPYSAARTLFSVAIARK